MSLKKFQRTKFRAYVKLGARQKSKQRYVKARGRHNKTRQKEKGRPVKVEIGFKRKSAERGLIEGKLPVVIHSLKDLEKVGENNVAIIGKIGKKKKIKIAEELLNRKIRVHNFNIEKFLEKIKKLTEHSKENHDRSK